MATLDSFRTSLSGLTTNLYAGSITENGFSFTVPYASYVTSILFGVQQVGTPSGNLYLTLYGTGNAPSNNVGNVKIYNQIIQYNLGNVNTLSVPTTTGATFTVTISGGGRVLPSGYYFASLGFAGGDSSNYLALEIDTPVAGNNNFTYGSTLGTNYQPGGTRYVVTGSPYFGRSHTFDTYISNAVTPDASGGYTMPGGWGAGYAGEDYGGLGSVRLPVTYTKTHTFDTLLKTSPIKTHSFDTQTKGRLTKAHTFDTIALGRRTRTHTFDTTAFNRLSRVHMFDTLTYGRFLKTHSFDTYTLGRLTKTHSFDTAAFARLSKAHTFDTIAFNRINKTHTFDTFTKSPGNAKFNIFDTLTYGRLTRTHSFDSLFSQRFTRTHSFDTQLRKTYTKTHSFDTITRSRRTIAHTFDTFTFGRISKIQSFDTITRARINRTHSFDTVTLSRLSRIHSFDTLTFARAIRTHTFDTVLRRGGALTHTFDTATSRRYAITHFFDTVLKIRPIKTHTFDTYLFIRDLYKPLASIKAQQPTLIVKSDKNGIIIHSAKPRGYVPPYTPSVTVDKDKQLGLNNSNEN